MRRSKGTGCITAMKDGRYKYRGLIRIGVNKNGNPKNKVFYGNTKKEVEEKINKFLNQDKPEPKDVIVFNDALDLLFEKSKKEKVKQKTLSIIETTSKILRRQWGENTIKNLYAKEIEEQLLLQQMTVEEKIGQLTQYYADLLINSEADFTGPQLERYLDGISTEYIGSILNFKNAEEAIIIQNHHLKNDRNKIPICFMMDVIHGYRTIYPIPLALGCSFNENIVFDCTKMASREAAAAGVHITFSPMVDYVRDARWGRVMESCGEDPLLNSIMGVTQVNAFRGDDLKNKSNLATCVKHFAAYGAAESGKDYNTVELSEHTLRELYLPAYKACLEAGVDC